MVKIVIVEGLSRVDIYNCWETSKKDKISVQDMMLWYQQLRNSSELSYFAAVVGLLEYGMLLLGNVQLIDLILY